LARYAPNDVREDADKQRLFMKGLYYELRLQLAGNSYPTFQALVNRVIVLDNMRYMGVIFAKQFLKGL